MKSNVHPTIQSPILMLSLKHFIFNVGYMKTLTISEKFRHSVDRNLLCSFEDTHFTCTCEWELLEAQKQSLLGCSVNEDFLTTFTSSVWYKKDMFMCNSINLEVPMSMCCLYSIYGVRLQQDSSD